MKKNISVILFLILALAALYLTRINYGDHGLKKTIAACVIAQIKKNKNMNKKTAEKFCKAEINKKLKK